MPSGARGRDFERPEAEYLWEWHLASEAKAFCGISAVPKKEVGSQRKILMPCSANYWLCDPRKISHSSLPGGEALADLHVPGNHWNIATAVAGTCSTYAPHAGYDDSRCLSPNAIAGASATSSALSCFLSGANTM